MDAQAAEIKKWDFPLHELFRLATIFYKKNSGKDSLHLSYDDNLKLIAFKQQSALGPFNGQHATELGVLDVIGRDRRLQWQMLGDISREQAMEGFIDLLDSMCSAFRPYVEAVKQNRDETIKADLLRIEKEKLEGEQQERRQKEIRKEGYKKELHRRELQDALNMQTYQQFKCYAEKQFPGNPEQQGVLIRQLQQEHYYQYVQLHMNDKYAQANLSLSSNNTNNQEADGNSSSANQSNAKATGGQVESDGVQIELKVLGDNYPQHYIENQTIEDDSYVVICPAKIWTRNDISDFKADVSAGDGDGVITIGHGDTVTVRVPTNVNGKCLFWEFATDNYDIGFGVYFEWSKPLTNDVTVHVSDSDEDDYIDEDYLAITDDLECGSLTNERNATLSSAASIKAPISIVVPIYRRECFNEVYVGSHAYPGEGVYLLKFDNSYSIWRSKTLYYRVYYER